MKNFKIELDNMKKGKRGITTIKDSTVWLGSH